MEPPRPLHVASLSAPSENPQALNRYAYVYNNPLRYTDPSGHCPWCVVIGKVLLQTAVDVGIDYLIARATGTDFNLVDSLQVNAALNVTTLGVGSTVAKLRHLGKVATLATHADEVADAARLAGHMGDGAHALITASRLRQVGAHSDEGARLIKALAEQSTRGSGSRVVIGKWVEGGGYIAEAQKHGGIYFETAEGVWDALGKDPELAWAVNEQFLRNQLEAGVSRIELVEETIERVLRDPTRSKSFTAREIRFLLQEAANYGYELIGNSWVKVR